MYDSLENVLHHFLQPHVAYLICGDLYINLLKINNDTLKLKSLMNTFNLMQVINFPTSINSNNSTLIDPSFVDTSIFTNIHVEPFINGLSDHDTQIIYL